MAVDLSKLTAAAERINTVKGAVLAFVQGVPGLIRDAVAADDMADATNINALRIVWKQMHLRLPPRSRLAPQQRASQSRRQNQHPKDSSINEGAALSYNYSRH